MRPFAIAHIDHLVLRVTDLARSVAFYRDVLGCRVSREREDLGMVHLATGSAMIDLVTLDGPLGKPGGAGPGPQGRNLHHFCLRIEPFDEQALTAYLLEQGIRVEPAERRYGAEGEGLSLYCYDPDGNQVELKGPVQD
ncbi:VOC family virulence protein [Pseudomonas sp. SWI6]|uniref:VOC family protein n=1 Tax=unclassified Pseudomonas TaxID=196821 RepID=UPI000CE5EA92|nr:MULTISPECIES: VOC family protein [unclassified Pseudomonas]AVD82990.1 VOC family virulence protein [Pseudomonas sp. SWI6]AVD90152.1 VOC family virulence protein [Pseudomonas sp. SWI44]MPT00157.1 VOC family protein [Pseudomonas sp.]WEZ86583.1 VOC family protein [Pseudomonas sp. NyZ480]